MRRQFQGVVYSLVSGKYKAFILPLLGTPNFSNPESGFEVLKMRHRGKSTSRLLKVEINTRRINFRVTLILELEKQNIDYSFCLRRFYISGFSKLGWLKL